MQTRFSKSLITSDVVKPARRVTQFKIKENKEKLASLFHSEAIRVLA
jgi:hypothetical protein